MAPDPAAAVELTRTAEDLGFESVWTTEHVAVPAGYQSTYPYSRSGRMPGSDDYPSPDPLVWLGYVAAATDRIRLATGVLVVPQRNPIVLAKQVATLDVLSGGRVTLGVGAGWLAEEFRVLGVSFSDRGDRRDEAPRLLRAGWTAEKPACTGRVYPLEDVAMRPTPAPPGGPWRMHPFVWKEPPRPVLHCTTTRASSPTRTLKLLNDASSERAAARSERAVYAGGTSVSPVKTRRTRETT